MTSVRSVVYNRNLCPPILWPHSRFQGFEQRVSRLSLWQIVGDVFEFQTKISLIR